MEFTILDSGLAVPSDIVAEQVTRSRRAAATRAAPAPRIGGRTPLKELKGKRIILTPDEIEKRDYQKEQLRDWSGLL